MIIHDFGILYRVSKQSFRRYCADWLDTQGRVNIRDYGRTIGHIEHTITNWTYLDVATAHRLLTEGERSCP